jgi:hypothetical protein
MGYRLMPDYGKLPLLDSPSQRLGADARARAGEAFLTSAPRNKAYMTTPAATTPAQTSNAVATATSGTPAQAIPGTPGYRDLDANPPRPDFGPYTGEAVSSPALVLPKAHDANMPNGSIKTVYQDSTYPGAVTPTAGLPRAQPPAGNFARFDDIGNTISLGGGGGGQSGGSFEMFNPGVQGQLHDLYTRSNQLLSSRSMVDNWRGRQLGKQMDRRMQAEAAMGNTRVGAATARAHMLSSQASALRAANEVPLAQMQDYTAQRGQDIQGESARANVEAHRYATDVGAATQEAQTAAQLRIHGSDVLRAAAQETAMRTGSAEAVKTASEAFSGASERVPHTPAVKDLPGGGVVIVGPDGKPQYYSQKSLEDMEKLPRLEAAAAARAKVK